jgi:PDZ domain-containing protein
MSYSEAQQMGVNVTYGWRLGTVASGGPSDGKLAVNDIIIALNGQTIKNNDDLASYLEEHTIPGDNLELTVVRGHSQIDLTITLGTRPAAVP